MPSGRCDLLTQNYEIPEKAFKAVPKPALSDPVEPLAEPDPDAGKAVAKTGDFVRDYEERMELQATQKKLMPSSNSRWTQNDHYFEENPEHSERSKPFAAPLQRDPKLASNHKQPTWETEAEDFHERERAKQPDRHVQAQRTPNAYPTKSEMKSRNLRDATPPKTVGRPDPQQLDPITNLPKPQRFAPVQSSGKSQQGQRVGRETVHEASQATAEKR
jgi:hypothetical protein